MNSYRNIPLWENTRRLRVLEEFGNDVVKYFDNSKYEWMLEGRTENSDAVQARPRINSTLDQARRIIAAGGISELITWTPPPAVGGHVQQLHVFPNLFELHRFHIKPQYAVDLIERTHGVYQRDRPAALRRTINPFWWLFRGLLWFTRIPFVFLGAVGFDAGRAEGSVFGKIFKLLLATSAALVSAAAAVLTILHHLGWLEEAKALLGI